MTPRTASRLASSLAALSVVVFLATVALFFLARSAPVPSGSSATRTVVDLMVSMPLLAFPLVGSLIASRRPQNPIGWICLADGLLWMLLGLFDYYSVYGLARPGSVPFPAAMAGLSLWLWVPTVGLLAVYLVLLFPDGRLPSGRWRPLAWLSAAVIVSLAVAEGLSPGPIAELGGARNPFGLEGQPWLAGATNALLAAFLGCIVASVASLVLRYRRSGGEERQQIKWIALAASVVGLGFVGAMLSGLLAPALAPELWREANAPPLWFEFFFSLVLLSFGGVPTAVGIAVLKYRLYDIDLLINRALVYGSLTFALVFSYVVSVVVLQALLRALTGQGSQLAVVASTLAIAALFSPLRRRLQAFVDRRFYREKYDARRTLELFSARLRAETDLEMLGEHLVGAVGEVMRPAHASLWLHPKGARHGKPAEQEKDVS
ncbi:MAG TPA: hypothetical protein VKA73_04240 [Rubrobacter sp.]|nr:hypothetical protein [Rubrobacter sp.]